MYIFLTDIVNNLTDSITRVRIEFRVGISHTVKSSMKQQNCDVAVLFLNRNSG